MISLQHYEKLAVRKYFLFPDFQFPFVQLHIQYFPVAVFKEMVIVEIVVKYV